MFQDLEEGEILEELDPLDIRVLDNGLQTKGVRD